MHNVQTRALPDANDYQVQGPDQEDNQPKNSRPTGLDTDSMPACTGQFMAWHQKPHRQFSLADRQQMSPRSYIGN